MRNSSGKDKANAFREQGNVFFKEGKYAASRAAYDRAIEVDPEDGALFCNRSVASLRLEEYGQAISDANQSVLLNCPKGLYRRGCALMALGRFAAAAKDFNSAAAIYPKNRQISEKLCFCEKEATRKAFLEAIHNENTLSPSERFDVSAMAEDAENEKIAFPLSAEEVNKLKEAMRRGERPGKKSAAQLILLTIEALKKEPNISESTIPKNATMIVCGDVHGQYYDLLNIFELNGAPGEANLYLFNGDFVDRGAFSVECALLLFSYKALYPRHFFINRGNHEAQALNSVYGFQREAEAKYDAPTYGLFSEAFQWLPLGHRIGRQTLAVHGGLFSRPGVTLAELGRLDRVREPPERGAMCELLWSDPSEAAEGVRPSRRGAGVLFGRDVAEEFLANNGLTLLVRSHEMVAEGFEYKFGGKLVTVFSAPNYCDTMGNKGAVLRFNDRYEHTAVPFAHVAHPEAKSYAMQI